MALLRPARRALAAETNRVRSQESLPCRLTRARRGASSRGWLSALQLRVGVKYARAGQRNRYRALPQIATYIKDRDWIEKRNDDAA